MGDSDHIGETRWFVIRITEVIEILLRVANVMKPLSVGLVGTRARQKCTC